MVTIVAIGISVFVLASVGAVVISIYKDIINGYFDIRRDYTDED